MLEAPPPKPRAPDPRDVLSVEANIEFFTALGDICYERAAELQRAKSKENEP